ncbi:MAG: hypothetical protein SFW35_14230 [Chitinophagales bacterium]|nr:hypothetical protein [Chitinophagales bacterium]
MTPIKVDSTIKCYSLHFLLDEFAINKNEYIYYRLPNNEKSRDWINLLSSFIKTLQLPEKITEPLLERALHIGTVGGIPISLEIKRMLYTEYKRQEPGVELDLNYLVERETCLFMGDYDVTPAVRKSKAYKYVVEKLLKDLYTLHENNNGNSGDNLFIEELFLMDGVDLAMGYDRMEINVERPLRDYLIHLNEKLKLSY